MSRTRSSTFSASIVAWSSAVQPGSPAPLSPATPATSKSVYTPSSAHQFDLTALGYTSVFVQLPTTPHYVNNNDNNSYPSPVLNLTENNNGALDNKRPCDTPKDNKPILDITSSNASRYRNPLAGVFRTRSKSMSHSFVPAKSSKTKRHAQPLPPALMNELLLLQFTSGGKLESHIARAVEKGAVADGKGGVWLDQEEEMEYEALMPKQRRDKLSSKEKRRPAPLNLARTESTYIPVSPPTAPKKNGKMSVRAFFSRA